MLYTWDLTRLVTHPSASGEPGITVAVTAADGLPMWAAPQALPFRIVLEGGSTLTSLSELPAVDLTELGFVLADPAPGHDPATHRTPRWDGAAATWIVEALSVQEIAAIQAEQLTADRAAKVDAITAERDRRLAGGAEHRGKRFSLSDASRTDLSGMATTAGLVLAGALGWPASYAQGWISADNSRLPLPAPQDGIALAAAVASAYSTLVQHARDLKDAALAGDPAAVDELLGWPD